MVWIAIGRRCREIGVWILFKLSDVFLDGKMKKIICVLYFPFLICQ